MLHDSLTFVPVAVLPQPPASDTAKIVFLSQQFGDFAPGLYVGSNGEWKPVGSDGGSSVKTITLDTDTYQVIDVANHVGDGLILSALVYKPQQEAKTLLLVDKGSEETLETVQLNKEYTPISIPQPYASYRLDSDPGLEVTFKVL